ncbi:DUF2835 domain-containing protein [Thalassolituus sp.]|jgi:hypothetical protein|uniref:DUF2835 domain-containing protein n=1 Tax=Thalassolituus sp. TaxID=2030822 RepID=UPI002620A7BD|nr:DUF2835 domain-containing protein [uncultured Thalassolituus sp.]TNC88271.1 MAG: hypothetical protein CSH36_13560 [Thalassolituus sp.]
MSQEVIVDIYISADEYQRYYRGSASRVVATTSDGRTVQFPAGVLQRVVGHDGVRGRFAIRFSQAGKFESIERLG